MKSPAQSVMIMAGGTGGHIFPGLAVADVFRRRGVEVRWLGAQGGMECKQVADHGISIDEVRISGVRGKGLMGWLRLPFSLLRAVLDAHASLSRYRPGVAISFGGYAAGPGGIAAKLGGIPLVVHEQNRVPGLTNKVLAKISKCVLQAFPGTFPERSGAITCGNPVRKSVAILAHPDERFARRIGRTRLLITGGSQGAQSLNQMVPEAVALLPTDVRPEVRHQAGRGNAAQTVKRYEEHGINADVHEFIEDISDAYAWADLVICRAGALTVSELAAAGLGSILVPYPSAVDDHQTLNAAFLADADAALLAPESGLSPATLAGHLESLLADRPGLLKMARAARSVAVSDAAERVVANCEQWVMR